MRITNSVLTPARVGAVCAVCFAAVLLMGVTRPAATVDQPCSGITRASSVTFPGQVVFGVVPDPSRPGVDFQGGYGPHLFVACLYRAGRIVALRPRDFDFTQFVAHRLVRDYLAYGVAENDFPFSRNKVEVVNLVTGGYVHQITATNGADTLKIEITPNGAVGWVEDDGDAFTLRVADRRGKRTPPHGRGISLRSVHLRGSRLRWKQRGRTYSLRLR